MTTNIEMSKVVYVNVMSTGTPLSGKKEDPAPPLSLPPTIPPTQPSTYLFQSTTHKPVHLSTPSTFLSYIHQSPVHLPHPPTGTVRCVTCPLGHNSDFYHVTKGIPLCRAVRCVTCSICTRSYMLPAVSQP